MHTRRYSLIIFLATLVYAVFRYHVFKGVPVEQFPLYVMNKIFSVTGLVLFGLAPFQSGIPAKKQMGLVAAGFLVGHVLMTCLIFNPQYFGKFYSVTGTLTWQAEISMFFGVIGTLFLASLYTATLSPVPQPCSDSLIPGMGRLVMLTGALHVFFMGYKGWFNVETWPGYLPPITLVSFVLAITLFALRFRSVRKKKTAIRTEELTTV